jgi:hypothetical protein
MRRLRNLAPLILLSGCYASESFLAVNTAMFRIPPSTSKDFQVQLQRELELVGYRLDRTSGVEGMPSEKFYLWFEGAHQTYAHIKIDPKGCAFLTVSVPVAENDHSQAAADFSAVVERLRRAGGWEVAEGFIC